MVSPFIFGRCVVGICLVCLSCSADRTEAVRSHTDFALIHEAGSVELEDNSHMSSARSIASAVADVSFMLVNPRSGGVEGQNLLEFMQENHPEIPAAPLGSINGKANNQMLSRLEKASRTGQHARVICAGGDGTASWCFSVLSSLQKQLKLKTLNAAVVMCPLGTGNDLSQSLGWGSGYPGDVSAWLQNALDAEAEFVLFDTWSLKFEPADDGESSCHSVEPHFNDRLKAGNTWPMILYMSTGWDARVIRNFERSTVPGLAQPLNKLQHAIRSLMTVNLVTNGSLGVTYRLCASKDKKCKEELDPGLDSGGSLAVLNTPSMTGGANLWGTPEEGSGLFPAQMDDEKLEVMASSGAVATGLSRWLPVQLDRLAQAKGLHLMWEAKEGGRAFQVDGDGLYCNGAGRVRIVRQGGVPMVLGPERASQFQKSAWWPLETVPLTSFTIFA